MRDMIYCAIITILALVTAYSLTTVNMWKSEVSNVRDYYKGQYEDLQEKEKYIAELQEENSDLKRELNVTEIDKVRLERQERYNSLLTEKPGYYVVVIGEFTGFDDNPFLYNKESNTSIEVSEPTWMERPLDIKVSEEVAKDIGTKQFRALIEFNTHKQAPYSLLDYETLE